MDSRLGDPRSFCVNFGGGKYPTAEKSTQILQSSFTEHPRHALRFQVLLIILIVWSHSTLQTWASCCPGLRTLWQDLMFVDPCIIVQFIKKNPTRCKNVSKFYYSIFIWSSTCFGRHTAHYQEPKTALAASGFSYVEGCWTCSWWTLSGTVLSLTTSTNYTSNNLPLIKNQKLPVQF